MTPSCAWPTTCAGSRTNRDYSPMTPWSLHWRRARQSPVAASTRPEPTDPPDPGGTPMSILDRAALEASPIADLHTIASELSIDGYRRLRKADLVDAILTRQDGGEAEAPAVEAAAPAETEPAAEADPESDAAESDAAESDAEEEPAPGAVGAGGVAAAEVADPGRPRRPGRGPGGGSSDRRGGGGARDRPRGRAGRAGERGGGGGAPCPVARALSAFIRPSPPTMTSTSPRPRSSGVSWSPATG